MPSLTPADMETVRRATMFSGLDSGTLEMLLADARVVECRRGKLLFLRGEPADRFYLVLSGWIKLFRDTSDGEQVVIHIMRAGETLAEAAVFMERNFPASAEAVDDSRLIEIPGRPFLAELRRNGDLALKLLADLSMRLHYMVQHIERLKARSTPQRLGEFILGLTKATEGFASVRLPYDKTLVAARLGMKPESLSRALAKLRTLGVATRGNTIELADVARLRAFCQADDGR